MSLTRKASNVPVLSRRSTSILSNGDVSELKRKSSSFKDAGGSPQLKRKRSSVKSTKETNGVASSLTRKTSSVKSTQSKPTSIVRKASSIKLLAKRIPKPKKFFEILETTTRTRKPGGKSKGKEKSFLYFNGEYLAIRTDDAEFYLCQAKQHVYETTKTFKIMWLNAVDGTQDIYSKEYVDTTEVDCIITHVKLRNMGGGQLRLLPAQKKIINDKLRQLKRGAIYYSDDVDSDDQSASDEDSEEDEEEDEEEEIEKKKSKRTTKKKAGRKPKKAVAKVKKPPKKKKVPTATLR